MDSNIVKCDVEFGMTVDPVFASKPSPSHESDSGCSDMSEVRLKSSTPAVKVVKVVRTAAQSKQEIDQELLQALDDRNKKNAVQAKVNREKKKVYMKRLEDEIEDLKCENFTLKESSRKAIDEKNELLEEVEYLRSVLANQSVLSGLLKNIGNVENVKLSPPTRKRSANPDHDYHNAPKHAKSSVNKTAGVCLHVDQGNLSLEFCSKCASMAKSGGKKGDS